MGRMIRSLVIVAALSACSACAGTSVGVRFYDAPHSDYHVWDAQEDGYYREYLTERHRPYVEFRHLRRGDQDDYWRWRHEHH